jgi:hypothetical protein
MSTSTASVSAETSDTRAASHSRIAQIESLLDALDPDLRRTLAHLNNADDQVAALTLALLPFGSRSALVGYGIIESNSSSESDQAVEVRLTSFGREMIAASALHADPILEQRLEDLDEAHAHRALETRNPSVRAVPAREHR